MAAAFHKPLHHFLLLALAGCLLAACGSGQYIARNQPINHRASTGSPQFPGALETATHTRWVKGNHVEPLVNGNGFYPPMLKAIRGAKKSITFETYAYVQGTAAYHFTSALCQRARAGVKVHVILDLIGSAKVGKVNITAMQQSGVEVKFYNRWSVTRPWQLNTRDHRKIMVVDGKTGFTGGCGVADAWLGNAQTPKHWRENHYRVTGPVVAQLQHCFENNWRKLGGQKLTGIDYYPPLKPTGNMVAQAFNSSPIEKQFTIPHLYRQAFASAEKSIVIENAYILLDKPMMQAILAARARGIHVEMIVPSDHNDAWLLRYLQQHQYHKLLHAGVHIYEYQPTMMHCKVLVVDGIFSSIGSANMDPRSLYLNDESNLNIISRKFARKQLDIIAQDRKKSIRITRAPSRRNPLTIPLRGAANLLFPHL